MVADDNATSGRTRNVRRMPYLNVSRSRVDSETLLPVMIDNCNVLSPCKQPRQGNRSSGEVGGCVV
jgi:hypothetical protein